MKQVLLLVSTCVLLASCDDGNGGGASGDDTVRAVVRAASCSGSSPTAVALISVPVLTGADVRCVLDADECEGVVGCLGGHAATCEGSMEVTCKDEQTVQTCDVGIAVERDCSWHGSGGPMCVQGSGDAACGVGSCEVEGESCDGTRIEDCEDGVLEVDDCGERGQTCFVIPGEGGGADSAICVDEEVEGCGEKRCNGNAMVRCLNEHEVTIDCDSQLPGSTCFEETDGSPYCALDDECKPDFLSPDETCDASSLNFCFLGKSTSIDCKGLGFDGCVTANGVAFCQ